MNIKTIIDQLNALKPNVFNTNLKKQWLAEVDWKVIELHKTYELNEEEQDVVDNWGHYSDDTSDSKELLLDVPFTDVYLRYLSAKIDFLQSDIMRYLNENEMFEQEFLKYANHFNRNHVPKKREYSTFGRKSKKDFEETIP